MIKLLSKGNDGQRELFLVQLLSSMPLRSNPDNAVMPRIEMLQLEDLHFVVMPHCDSSSGYPFLNAREFFEFSIQILNVGDFSKITVLFANLTPGHIIFASTPHRPYGIMNIFTINA